MRILLVIAVGGFFGWQFTAAIPAAQRLTDRMSCREQRIAGTLSGERAQHCAAQHPSTPRPTPPTFQ